ncbi:endonuclease domain-containing protein [Salinarimonas chemoclinalis]|uniref:endonuclease domain-containing protein n=1 Tax=Salinarimonas chemoclinalis TaxID=3241599 RepID=UPI0035575D14
MAWNQPPARSPSAAARRAAGPLRRRLSPAEKRLWWCLRHRLALDGTHFRRQVTLGPYVVDFCCLKHKLVIEVDGASHSYDSQQARDAVRDATLEGQGFRVLRFTNDAVLREIDVVMDTVHAHLAEVAAVHA